MPIAYDWDPEKDRGNQAKHGASFGEAATVFRDLLSATIHDPEHSDEEDRFITVGTSDRNRLLVVVHADEEDMIRIISARTPTRAERRQYEEGA